MAKSSDERAFLRLRDPVLPLLWRLSRHNTARAVGTVVAASTALLLAGLAVSLWADRDPDMLPIYDANELPFVLYYYLVMVPFVVVVYLRQSGLALVTLRDLEHGGAVVAPSTSSPGHLTVEAFLQTARSRVSWQAAVPIVVLLVAASSQLNWAHKLPPRLFGDQEVIREWFAISPWFLWLAWFPFSTLVSYMAIWLGVRHVWTVIVFARFFRAFDVRPLPFHPDRCNGLGAIDDFTRRTTLVAVFLWLAFEGVLQVQRVRIYGATDVATFAVNLPYFLFAPWFLVAPAWQAHLELSQAKTRALEPVAAQMRELLAQGGPIEPIEELKKRYDLIDREYRTWPLRKVQMRRLAVVTAVAPVITSAVSLWATVSDGAERTWRFLTG